jgi:hypothetical protein
LDTVSGALAGAATSGAAAVAAGATLAAVLPVTGTAVVLAGTGAEVAGAAVLPGAGVVVGVADSFLPQALSNSRPARLALYKAVERMKRVMGTPGR